MNIVSIITSILGWVLGKVFGMAKESRTEKKYADAMKENLELRAQNAGLWKRKELEEKETKLEEEWENSDEERKFEILKRDFSDLD